MASRGKEVKLGDTPARVVAYVARRAAARRLQGQGFELCSARKGQPIRLSRRKRNLAEPLVDDKLSADVGAFAALSVQGFAIRGDDNLPGPVALIIGQWVAHVLDLELSVLEAHGVDLRDARVRWRHQRDCSCDRAARVGDAGRVQDGDTGADLNIRDLGGEDVKLPAACLAVHANKKMLTRYLAGLSGKPDRTISEGLRGAVQALDATDKRWRNLENTAKQLFGELELFDGVTANVSQPLIAPTGSKLNGSGPVVLPVLAEGELNFGYGSQKLSKRPQFGLKEHGPYDEGQHRTDVLRAVVVAPEVFKPEAKRLKDILTMGVEASKTFKGLKSRYKLREFECELTLFADETRLGYEHAMAQATKTGLDIVFFVTRWDYRYARRGENLYLAAKSVLASAGMPSQAVTIETLRQSNSSLQWSADSVGLAAYTKIGNVPFVLHDPVSHAREIVLGVGRSDVYDPEKGGRRQIYGSAVVCRQDGDFLFAGSTAGVSAEADYEEHLERLIADNVARYQKDQGQELERLVIYLFKRTGRRELNAVQAALKDSKVAFALLHVNRDSPIWLVNKQAKSIINPQRGLMVALGEHDRLLATGDPGKPTGSHPLRLELDRQSTYDDMDRLVSQAYALTKTTYRGFLQGNEPSPLVFGRLLAEKVEQLVPYGFNPATTAGPLGERPWFI
jgi:hypothetical protein